MGSPTLSVGLTRPENADYSHTLRVTYSIPDFSLFLAHVCCFLSFVLITFCSNTWFYLATNQCTNDTSSTRREPFVFELFHSGSEGRH